MRSALHSSVRVFAPITAAKGARGEPDDTSCASVPAKTTMNSRYDEGSAPEPSVGIHARQREDSPELNSFQRADLIGKPLVAFEPLPAHTALPSTWGSGNSRSPVHMPDVAAEAS